MKSLACICLSLLFCGPLWAKSGLLVGLNYSQYEAEVGGMEFTNALGIDLGYHLVADLGWPVLLRTGATLSYRSTTLNAGSLEIEIDDFYSQVPATALYRFNKTLSAFAGLNLLFHLGGVCDSNATNDCDYNAGAEGILLALTAGGNVVTMGPSSIEVYYEKALGNAYTNVKAGALGLRYLYSID